MKLRGRIFVALAGAPVLLAGMVLAGSSAFGGRSVVGLNQLSDTVRFTGVLTVENGTVALRSTTCTITDAPVKGGEPTALPCHLVSQGTVVDPVTHATRGVVTVTGDDGAITIQQTTSNGCSFGTGREIDSGHVVPVRTEGSSMVLGPPTSNGHQFNVSGLIDVYEAGGAGIIGDGCSPG